MDIHPHENICIRLERDSTDGNKGIRLYFEALSRDSFLLDRRAFIHDLNLGLHLKDDSLGIPSSSIEEYISRISYPAYPLLLFESQGNSFESYRTWIHDSISLGDLIANMELHLVGEGMDTRNPYYQEKVILEAGDTLQLLLDQLPEILEQAEAPIKFYYFYQGFSLSDSLEKITLISSDWIY
ncbi:MAG: hypothetical protein AAFR61_05370 [Bacteroidota bacterium]